jgi:hypothetical protein
VKLFQRCLPGGSEAERSAADLTLIDVQMIGAVGTHLHAWPDYRAKLQKPSGRLNLHSQP